MRNAGLVLIVLLLTAAGPVMGQKVPDPPPSKNPHAWADADKQYPSAAVCGECHPNQYKQWSISSHVCNRRAALLHKLGMNAG